MYLRILPLTQSWYTTTITAGFETTQARDFYYQASTFVLNRLQSSPVNSFPLLLALDELPQYKTPQVAPTLNCATRRPKSIFCFLAIMTHDSLFCVRTTVFVTDSPRISPFKITVVVKNKFPAEDGSFDIRSWK